MCMLFRFVDFRCRLWISSLFVTEESILKFASFGLSRLFCSLFFLFWFLALYFGCCCYINSYMAIYSIYLFETHTHTHTSVCARSAYVSVQRKGFIKWLLLWAFSFNGSLMHRLSHPVQLLAIKRSHFSTVVIWRVAFFWLSYIKHLMVEKKIIRRIAYSKLHDTWDKMRKAIWNLAKLSKWHFV